MQEKSNIPSGLYFVDKPKGMTSFDVIRKLRKILGIRKMGHSGTLDPLATGLLIIAVGDATKKLHGLLGLPKTYEAEILLGVKTDSGDVTGVTQETLPVPKLSDEAIEREVRNLIGVHNLPAPLYSALKKDGKPLYAYARSKIPVSVPTKRMEVLDARHLSHDGDTVRVFFYVSSGTYIRTIAELLGERLGTVATIKNLRRLSIGEYSVEEAGRYF